MGDLLVLVHNAEPFGHFAIGFQQSAHISAKPVLVHFIVGFDMMSLAIRVNDFLTGLFLGVGIRLVDFKIECGRQYENDVMRIVVADEISPDSCRLWDVETNEKMDKDRFRRDMGGLLEAYREVAKRLGIMNENEQVTHTGPRLVK